MQLSDRGTFTWARMSVLLMPLKISTRDMTILEKAEVLHPAVERSKYVKMCFEVC